jgi:hypothetical protein
MCSISYGFSKARANNWATASKEHSHLKRHFSFTESHLQNV